MRSSSVVTHLTYEDGKISYQTHDAPAPSVDVLRLAFEPKKITGDSKPLPTRSDLDSNGYLLEKLPDGDCIVTIRHDGKTLIIVEGDDPQIHVSCLKAEHSGQWHHEELKQLTQWDPSRPEGEQS